MRSLRWVRFGLFVVLAGLIFRGVSAAEDKVERRDKTGKLVTVKGTISEQSPAGIKIKSGTKEELIPVSEITRVQYEVPPILSASVGRTYNAEESEKDATKLYKEFSDIKAKPDFAGASANFKRYVEYRLLGLSANMADNDTKKGTVLNELRTFVTTHNGSWEYSGAAKMLAQMQIDKPDLDGARATLEALGRSKDVPADVKQDAETMLIDVMFQQGQTEAVKAKLSQALANPKLSPLQKTRYELYQLAGDGPESAKKIKDLIEKTNDPSVKAIGYNVLGDLYSAASNKREAMWAYLWVDVVYPQDKPEHLKAMRRLLKYFQEESDGDKVKLYMEKIARTR